MAKLSESHDGRASVPSPKRSAPVSDIDTEVVDSLKVPTRLMTASLIGRLVTKSCSARDRFLVQRTLLAPTTPTRLRTARDWIYYFAILPFLRSLARAAETTH